ncbi:MAG TPA: aldehyde dehydrogenase, partial [Alphaproteobacteria bacterium]|nr:aldehyde dehydrogenase [Alphaproteobacteria bacterium]
MTASYQHNNNTCIFINNEWLPCNSGETLNVFEPATGQCFTKIAAGNAADIDVAVRAGRAALSGEWGQMAAVDRGRLLVKVGTLILAHFDELAALEARDTGKP